MLGDRDVEQRVRGVVHAAPRAGARLRGRRGLRRACERRSTPTRWPRSRRKPWGRVPDDVLLSSSPVAPKPPDRRPAARAAAAVTPLTKLVTGKQR